MSLQFQCTLDGRLGILKEKQISLSASSRNLITEPDAIYFTGPVIPSRVNMTYVMCESCFY